MIVEGKIQTDKKRSPVNGKPYTFDLDSDYFRITIEQRPVAYSDYFPRQGAPNEYIILDFDKDGRVVGFAMEGLLAKWASESLGNRLKLTWARVSMNATSMALASRVISELGKKTILDAFPKVDPSGRLPSYA